MNIIYDHPNGHSTNPIFHRFHFPTPVIEFIPHNSSSFNFIKVLCIVECFAVNSRVWEKHLFPYKVPPLKFTFKNPFYSLNSFKTLAAPAT